MTGGEVTAGRFAQPGTGVEDSSNLEIQIARTGNEQYSVQLRYTPAGDEADTWYPGSKPIPFRPQAGTDAEIDPKEVGRQIRDDLCADPKIAEGLTKVLAGAAATDEHLHVRLFIDPGAAELQLLPWETLAEPNSDRFLFAGERTSFSRFLAGTEFRRIRRQSETFSTAALVIANPPSDAVAALDVDAIAGVARAALDGLALTEKISGGAATLDAIVECASADTEILWLVCHGTIVDHEPWLWLEKPDGKVDRVAAETLIERLQELRCLPRLVVLYSCRSSGDDVEFHAALGPRLAAIGVPAVLAMRGDVPVESAGQFLAAFFSEVRAHGVLDFAASVARRAVADAGAAWMPVLFSRLRSGRIWSRPGFVGGAGGARLAERWGTLIDRIGSGKCTPILGPLLMEPLIGSSRDLAAAWSVRFGFPLAPQDRENLTSVSQYIATNQDPARLLELFDEGIRDALRRNFGPRVNLPANASLDDLMAAGWNAYSATHPAEPHRLLAGLPFRIYLTTATSRLLERSLEAAGKTPQSDLFLWNDDFYADQSIYTKQPNYKPVAEEPLVFHLFGHADEPASHQLLTEDDYFDYLIKSTRNRDRAPPDIRRVLNDTALLFVGFNIDDWSFRVLFRSLMTQFNSNAMKRFSHVAVQIDPEEGRIQEPGRARRYLETYFEQMGNISIFWGSAEEFTAELGRQWQAAQPAAAAE